MEKIFDDRFKNTLGTRASGRGFVFKLVLVFLWPALLIFPRMGSCLEPNEILVLANRDVPESVSLAEYYIEKRSIPKTNLLRLRVRDDETCTRAVYEEKIIPPVRKSLARSPFRRRIRCLVIMFGLPLRIEPPEMSPESDSKRKDLLRHKALLMDKLKDLNTQEAEARQEIERELKALEREISALSLADQGSSLDSEIALVKKEDYPLTRWIPNPLFLWYQGRYILGMPDKGEVLMVSRLDGPDARTVRRIIDQSLQSEREGLKGVAYFDARWPRPTDEKKKADMGYAFYDDSIHAAAEVVRQSGRMPVVLNEKEELFKAGECPNAALYCGWYSLARYVDAFAWVPGSVGYHIASSECQTLKKTGSQVWCKRMLEEGVAATLGPVSEPYVQAFPVPELFFKDLVQGYWTLAECYARSQPFWSWKMVLIGDPLYRPFAKMQKSED